MTKQMIKAVLAKEKVLTENSDASRDLFNLNCFGKVLDQGRVQLSLLEALYLMEKNKLVVVDGRNKEIDAQRFIKKAQKIEPEFWIRYCVLKDMRDRGYIIKTALKFGADFRVYDRGIKPGQDHAKWVLYPVHEASAHSWFDFSAKMRVSHSTKKKLLIGVVDDEGDVTYYEIRWMRP